MKTLYIPRRYLLVTGTFFISLLLYIDRACISAAKDPIAGSLGLTDNQMGWVLSIFAIGYALFQIPGGIFADRYGPRRVLGAIIALWSVFTAFTGLVRSFITLLVVRFFFGAGEAGAFPNLSQAVYKWIPLKERGLVQGINFSGSRLGAAFAMPLVALLISALGWRMSFVVLGIFGMLFAVLWYWLFRDDPKDHRAVSEEEKEYILSTRQETAEEKTEKLSAGILFGSTNMWLAMIQYFGSNFTFFFCLTWLYPHLKDKFDLEIVEAGFYTSIPLIFGAVGNWISGFMVDLIYRTGKWNASRKIPAILGFLFIIIGLIASLYMETVTGAVIFLSLAIMGADMTLSPSWSFCIDIGKKNAGTISGTMNMAGNVGSFLTALAFPYLLSWTGSEVPFFYVAAALSLISIFCWLYMKPEKPLLKSL